MTYFDISHPCFVFISVFEEKFHSFESVHGFDESHVLFKLNVRVEHEVLLEIESLNSANTGFHHLPGKSTTFNSHCTIKGTSIEACLFKHPFYKGSRSKGIKQRALHVHQRKTKHFIAKLFPQPFILPETFLILVAVGVTWSFSAVPFFK